MLPRGQITEQEVGERVKERINPGRENRELERGKPSPATNWSLREDAGVGGLNQVAPWSQLQVQTSALCCLS